MVSLCIGLLIFMQRVEWPSHWHFCNTQALRISCPTYMSNSSRRRRAERNHSTPAVHMAGVARLPSRLVSECERLLFACMHDVYPWYPAGGDRLASIDDDDGAPAWWTHCLYHVYLFACLELRVAIGHEDRGSAINILYSVFIIAQVDICLINTRLN